MKTDIELIRGVARIVDPRMDMRINHDERVDMADAIYALADRMEKAEPVAWKYQYAYHGNKWFFTTYSVDLATYNAMNFVPLFTHPASDEVEALSAIQKQRDRYEQQNAELQVEVERLKADNKDLAYQNQCSLNSANNIGRQNSELRQKLTSLEAQLSAIKKAYEAARKTRGFDYIPAHEAAALGAAINQQEGE